MYVVYSKLLLVLIRYSGLSAFRSFPSLWVCRHTLGSPCLPVRFEIFSLPAVCADVRASDSCCATWLPGPSRSRSEFPPNVIYEYFLLCLLLLFNFNYLFVETRLRSDLVVAQLDAEAKDALVKRLLAGALLQSVGSRHRHPILSCFLQSTVRTMRSRQSLLQRTRVHWSRMSNGSFARGRLSVHSFPFCCEFVFIL